MVRGRLVAGGTVIICSKHTLTQIGYEILYGTRTGWNSLWNLHHWNVVYHYYLNIKYELLLPLLPSLVSTIRWYLKYQFYIFASLPSYYVFSLSNELQTFHVAIFFVTGPGILSTPKGCRGLGAVVWLFSIVLRIFLGMSLWIFIAVVSRCLLNPYAVDRCFG